MTTTTRLLVASVGMNLLLALALVYTTTHLVDHQRTTSQPASAPGVAPDRLPHPSSLTSGFHVTTHPEPLGVTPDREERLDTDFDPSPRQTISALETTRLASEPLDETGWQGAIRRASEQQPDVHWPPEPQAEIALELQSEGWLESVAVNVQFPASQGIEASEQSLATENRPHETVLQGDFDPMQVHASKVFVWDPPLAPEEATAWMREIVGWVSARYGKETMLALEQRAVMTGRLMIDVAWESGHLAGAPFIAVPGAE